MELRNKAVMGIRYMRGKVEMGFNIVMQKICQRCYYLFLISNRHAQINICNRQSFSTNPMARIYRQYYITETLILPNGYCLCGNDSKDDIALPGRESDSMTLPQHFNTQGRPRICAS